MRFRKPAAFLMHVCAQLLLPYPGPHEQGRPVTYSCISQGETGGLVPADCVMHAAYLIENLVPSITTDASTYVWILDFTGIVSAPG